MPISLNEHYIEYETTDDDNDNNQSFRSNNNNQQQQQPRRDSIKSTNSMLSASFKYLDDSRKGYTGNGGHTNNNINNNMNPNIRIALQEQQREYQNRRKCIQLSLVISLLSVVFLSFFYIGYENSFSSSTRTHEQEIAESTAFTHHPPPSNMHVECSLDILTNKTNKEQQKERQSYCHYLCSTSNCCNIPQGKVGSCVSEYSISCDRYNQYCDDISSILGQYETIPIVAQQNSSTLPVHLYQNKKLCSGQILSFKHWNTCSNLCVEGTCCILSTFSPKSCLLQDNEEVNNLCLEYYTNCKTIYNNYLSHVRVPSPPTTINDICSLENIRSSSRGEQKCRSICHKATCCHTASLDDSNMSCQHVNNRTCAFYSPCQNLITDVDFTTNDDDGISQKIQQACSDSTDIISLSNCFQLCTPASCCFDTSTTCSTDIDCMIYERCTVVFHQFQQHQPKEEENESTSSLLSNQDKIFLIEQTCTTSKISTQEGWRTCFDLCKERHCCFTTNDHQGCYEDNKDWCEEYKSCETVFLADYDNNSNDAILFTSSETFSPSMFSLVINNNNTDTSVQVDKEDSSFSSTLIPTTVVSKMEYPSTSATIPPNQNDATTTTATAFSYTSKPSDILDQTRTYEPTDLASTHNVDDNVILSNNESNVLTDTVIVENQTESI